MDETHPDDDLGVVQVLFRDGPMNGLRRKMLNHPTFRLVEPAATGGQSGKAYIVYVRAGQRTAGGATVYRLAHDEECDMGEDCSCQ